MTFYMVARPRCVSRAHVNGGGRTVRVWVPVPRYGTHARNVDAKRAYMEAVEPDLRGTSDSFIRHHFDAQARSSMATAKIVKTTTEESMGTKTIECECKNDVATRFDIETTDGRLFEGAHVHGAGGLIHGKNALAYLRRRLDGFDFHPDGGEPRTYIDVYTLWSAKDERRVRLALTDVRRVRVAGGAW